jgi:hypothetical protein
MHQYQQFDPFDLLEELSRQLRDQAHHIDSLIENQNQLVKAYSWQQQRLETQGQMIHQLNQRIIALEQVTLYEETNSRPTR